MVIAGADPTERVQGEAAYSRLKNPSIPHWTARNKLIRTWGLKQHNGGEKEKKKGEGLTYGAERFGRLVKP